MDGKNRFEKKIHLWNVGDVCAWWTHTHTTSHKPKCTHVYAHTCLGTRKNSKWVLLSPLALEGVMSSCQLEKVEQVGQTSIIVIRNSHYHNSRISLRFSGRTQSGPFKPRINPSFNLHACNFSSWGRGKCAVSGVPAAATLLIYHRMIKLILARARETDGHHFVDFTRLLNFQGGFRSLRLPPVQPHPLKSYMV